MRDFDTKYNFSVARAFETGNFVILKSIKSVQFFLMFFRVYLPQERSSNKRFKLSCRSDDFVRLVPMGISIIFLIFLLEVTSITLFTWSSEYTVHINDHKMSYVVPVENIFSIRGRSDSCESATHRNFWQICILFVMWLRTQNLCNIWNARDKIFVWEARARGGVDKIKI